VHVTRAAVGLRAVFGFGALATVALAACGADSPCGATEGKVTRVIDGDTIEVEGFAEPVRYLLVDTPEISGGVECFGDNAKTYNQDLVLNKMINISYDEQCTDMYGRSLAYVTVDGEEVNARLVRQGYACVLFIPPNGSARAEEFMALQLEAKNAQRGLWGACNPLPPACK
jgi:micrococcal nuclease